MAYKITSSGEITKIAGAHKGGKLTLEQMQEAVGGYIEIVRFRYCRGEGISVGPMPPNHGEIIPITDKTLMIVNEEGRIKGLPINRLGCLLYGTDKHFEPIVGDILLAEFPSEVD